MRRKAAERLAAAADVLMAQLLGIAASAESEAVRLSAIKDALDRAGFAPAQMVKFGLAQDDPFGDLLKEILSDPDLIIEDTPRRALPTPDRGWGDEWLPERDTIPGEVIREPAATAPPAQPASAPASPPRGKRIGAVVKVPTHIRSGLRLDPDPGRATFAP
ncbi:hypothetical protein ASD90_04425 [Terrabacter sp. Root181]|nr:hypothetical protein ASD90_04425 [Terrabacter sp. Root181]